MVSNMARFISSAQFQRHLPWRVETDVQVAALTNLLTVHERMDESLAYQITKLLHERTADLVAVHQAAQEITLKSAVVGSPIPFHPGALRYYGKRAPKFLPSDVSSPATSSDSFGAAAGTRSRQPAAAQRVCLTLDTEQQRFTTRSLSVTLSI